MRDKEATERPLGRNLCNETDLMTRLRDGGLHLPPAQLRLIEGQPHLSYNRYGDGIVEVAYRGRSRQYILECKSRSTPQVVQSAMLSAQRFSAETGLPPLVIVPYLSEEALGALETNEVSGVDLSGNGILLSPDFTIRRSGQPNRYREVQPIRNLYRGASSLFVRCLLLRDEFASLKAWREYALSRLYQASSLCESKLTMGTASKVAQQLEQELLIQRDGRELRVIDAARLMNGLRTGYRASEGTRLVGKTLLPADEIWRLLDEQQTALEGIAETWRYVATGLGSAGRYRVLSGPEKLTLYVSDLDRAADLIELRPSRVFPNVELVEDRDDAVYFDARRNGAEIWASPIQTWLELIQEGPREREAAETLAAALIKSRGEQFV